MNTKKLKSAQSLCFTIAILFRMIKQYTVLTFMEKNEWKRHSYRGRGPLNHHTRSRFVSVSVYPPSLIAKWEPF